jgi:SPX domain protein involved in polyphosphate accumulation
VVALSVWRMKFGKYLQENVYPEWRFYYIDYDGLKRILKERRVGESFAEKDEAHFVESLDKEMQKGTPLAVVLICRSLIFEMSKPGN